VNFGLPIAAAAAALFGTADFLGGYAARRASALMVTLVVSLVGAIPVIALALWAGGHASRADLLWGAAGGVAGASGVTLLYYVLARGPVGVVAPISAVCGVTVPVAVGLLMGERPTPAAAIGIALAVAAVVMVNGGAPDAKQPRAAGSVIVLAVLSGLGLGAFLVFLARVSPGAGLSPLLAARGAGALTVTVALLARREKFVLPPGARQSSLLGAMIDGFANVLYLLVVRTQAVSVVATIVSLAPALTVLLGRLVLKEQFHRRQSFGLGLAALAVVLLTSGH
jgi:drug/metabolite transporter (DMT)-like permease